MALTKVFIRDLTGPRGPIGPDGLPGLDAVPTVSGLASYVLGAAANAFRDALFTLFGKRIWGAGIDNTGVADSTSAIQAIIDANPGKRLYLPAGIYKITSLSLSKGQHLVGAGQQDWRDRNNYYGDASWATNTAFNGTVLRSAITTGSVISILDTEVSTGGVADLSIIGPGTGSSVGITIGSATWAICNVYIDRVKIGNMFIGVRTYGCYEGSFNDLMLRGCDTGLWLSYQSNQNQFTMLDAETCGDGVKISADSYVNGFYSPIAQSNTRTGMIIEGVNNAFYNPYFENNGVRAMDFLPTAQGNTVDTPYANDANDSFRVQAGARNQSFKGGNITTAITNAGDRSYFQGRYPGLVDTGNDTIIIDPLANGTPHAPWKTYTPTTSDFTVGAGTTVGKFTKHGKTVTGRITFALGAGSSVVGTPTFTLPATIIAGLGTGTAKAIILKQGTGWVDVMAVLQGSTVAVGRADPTTGLWSAFTSSLPYAFVSGDQMTIDFTYECA